jgi:hypothetical protein
MLMLLLMMMMIIIIIIIILQCSAIILYSSSSGLTLLIASELSALVLFVPLPAGMSRVDCQTGLEGVLMMHFNREPRSRG